MPLRFDFEYFLNRIAWAWANAHLESVLRKAARSAKRRSDLQKVSATLAVVSSGEATLEDHRTSICEALVPQTGLDLFTSFFKEFCGVVLSSMPDYYQIRVAFEVRHKIEHTNGRIDGKFLDSFKKDQLRSTSWGDRLEAMHKRGARVSVLTRDVDATHNAMAKAAPWIHRQVSAQEM